MPTGIYKRKPFSKEHCYNISESIKGKNHPIFGKKRSEETRQKISKSLKNRKFSKERCNNISKSMKGKKSWNKGLTKETDKRLEKSSQKISESMKGKKKPLRSKEHCKAISESRKGKYCGEKNSAWCGGTSREPYCQEFTKDLKDFIKERDNYKCMTPLCDKSITKNNPIGVHHIDYNKKNCELWNLILNCRSCNFIANFNRDYWQEIYRTIIKQNYIY